MGTTEEIVVWQGSQSQVLNLKIFISMSVLVILIIVLGIMFFPLAMVLCVIPLFYMFYKWLAVKNNKYKITTERIFYTTGIFSKRTETLELYRVKDLEMYEPFWERIFKLGNIDIRSSDQTNPNFLLKAVPKPQDLLNSIRKNVETRRDVKRVSGVEFMGDETFEHT